MGSCGGETVLMQLAFGAVAIFRGLYEIHGAAADSTFYIPAPIQHRLGSPRPTSIQCESSEGDSCSKAQMVQTRNLLDVPIAAGSSDLRA